MSMTIERLAEALDIPEADLKEHFCQSKELNAALTCPCLCHILIGPSDQPKTLIQGCVHCRLLG
jgi:hypothetical protein